MANQPDSTAVRVWRALHVEIDPPPHVLEDPIGLALATPDQGWHERGDMHPQGTARFRASIVALNRRYFAGRKDGLRTSNAEEMIVATV
jgi:hypothetical protein